MKPGDKVRFVDHEGLGEAVFTVMAVDYPYKMTIFVRNAAGTMEFHHPAAFEVIE